MASPVHRSKNSESASTITAASRYKELEQDREPFLRRARDCASYTIPALFPPEGHSDYSTLQTPYQSLGSRGVNNLAAKLLTALLPPNAPFFRLAINDFSAEQDMSGERRSRIEEGLSKVERAVMKEIHSAATRVTIYQALLQLIVGGNALIEIPKKGKAKTHNLANYVVQRSPDGEVLEIIIQEVIAVDAIPEAVQEQLDLGGVPEGSGQTVVVGGKPVDPKGTEKTKTFHTWVRASGGKYVWHQECDEVVIDGSSGSSPKESSPWIACRWTVIDDESYGRSHVDDLLGDLASYEDQEEAIVQMTQEASRIVHLVDPSSTISVEQFASAQTGDALSGKATDVTAYQLGKYTDLQVVLNSMDRKAERLTAAFLMNASIQRQAERVTAEEIRFLAEELESALGGLYSLLTIELQLPLVHRFMHRMQASGRLPALPEEIVEPVVSTGLEAIGRGIDLNRLQSFVAGIAQIPEAVQMLNLGEFVKRYGTSLGIDMDGLVAAPEELAAQQQQSRLMALVEKLGPEAISQLGKGINQQQQQEGGQ